MAGPGASRECRLGWAAASHALSLGQEAPSSPQGLPRVSEQGGRGEGELEAGAGGARAGPLGGPLGSLPSSSLAVLSHSSPTGNGTRLPATSGLEGCKQTRGARVGPGEVGGRGDRGACAERPGRVDGKRVSDLAANRGVFRGRDKWPAITDSLQSPERLRRPRVISSPVHHSRYGNVPPVRATWAGLQPRHQPRHHQAPHQPRPLHAPISICISLAVLCDEKVLECR